MTNNINNTQQPRRKPGRPKGSKNKPKLQTDVTYTKNGSAIIKVELEKNIEGTPIIRNSNRGWINWGRKNDYPQNISTLYYNSGTHRSCIDFTVNAIIGNGIDWSKTDIDLSPNYRETWDDFIEKIVLDYTIYGSFAFQVIKNKDGKTYSFFHEPLSNVRCSEKDEDGDITSYWVSSDWTDMMKNPPVELPRFGFQEDETIAAGKPYLYVYETYNPDIEYYYVPRYIASIKDIQTEMELSRFDLRTVVNNFSASGIITLPMVDDEEERNDIVNNIQQMYSGSDNANSVMITFKHNIEDKPVEFTPIDKQTDNVNLFDDLYERVKEKIISAHRIPSKQLLGYSSENAMLGGSGNELNTAFNLYNNMVAKKLRNNIIRTINNMFRLNGVDIEITLLPLDFSVVSGDDDVKSTRESDEEVNNN